MTTTKTESEQICISDLAEEAEEDRYEHDRLVAEDQREQDRQHVEQCSGCPRCSWLVDGDDGDDDGSDGDDDGSDGDGR